MLPWIAEHPEKFVSACIDPNTYEKTCVIIFPGASAGVGALQFSDLLPPTIARPSVSLRISPTNVVPFIGFEISPLVERLVVKTWLNCGDPAVADHVNSVASHAVTARSYLKF